MLTNKPKLLVEQFKKMLNWLTALCLFSILRKGQGKGEKDLPRQEHQNKNNYPGDDSYSLFKAIIA